MSLYSLPQENLAQLNFNMVEMTDKLIEYLPLQYTEMKELIDDDFEDCQLFGDEDEEEEEIEGEKLDGKICEVQDAIDKLKKERKQLFDDEAHEYFLGLEDQIYCDFTDDMNEILLFETTINNLPNQNAILYQEIKNNIPATKLADAGKIFELCKNNKDSS